MNTLAHTGTGLVCVCVCVIVCECVCVLDDRDCPSRFCHLPVSPQPCYNPSTTNIPSTAPGRLCGWGQALTGPGRLGRADSDWLGLELWASEWMSRLAVALALRGAAVAAVGSPS